MTDSFFQLHGSDQLDILNTASNELSMSPQILEKDIWVCWTLRALFSMPDALPMAFKGGTSLSKIWNAIDRFSEDVDVTIDYRAFKTGFDHTKGKLSNSKQRIENEKLQACVKDYTENTVAPYLTKKLKEDLKQDAFKISLSECGEQLTIQYPCVSKSDNSYIKDSVLLEFGGRNTLEPNAVHTIETYITKAKNIKGVDFPIANDVRAIDSLRTFWEKVTLIHAECNRNRFGSNVERLSRHWYDLSMLIDNVIKIPEILHNDSILREIIAIKKVFYYSASAEYDQCTNGELKLIPQGVALEHLASDYKQMIVNGMFSGTIRTFEEVIEKLKKLEDLINTHYSDLE